MPTKNPFRKTIYVSKTIFSNQFEKNIRMVGKHPPDRNSDSNQVPPLHPKLVGRSSHPIKLYVPRKGFGVDTPRVGSVDTPRVVHPMSISRTITHPRLVATNWTSFRLSATPPILPTLERKASVGGGRNKGGRFAPAYGSVERSSRSASLYLRRAKEFKVSFFRKKSLLFILAFS